MSTTRQFTPHSVDEMVGFFLCHSTTIGAQRMLAPSVGCWVSFDGTVRDVVQETGGGREWVQVFAYTPTGSRVSLSIDDPDQMARGALLDRGARVLGIGKVAGVYGVTLFLDACELSEKSPWGLNP